MIAVAIVGALAAISVPNALAARISGNDSTAKVLLGGLAERQSAWFQTNFTYWPWTVPGSSEAQVVVVHEGGDTGSTFIPGLTRPASNHVYFLTVHDDASSSDRYCVAVQQHREQSNLWVWSSGSSEFLRVDRDTVAAAVGASFLERFTSAAGTACSGAVSYD